MNSSGFVLIIPLLGLVPICREGRWTWSVVPRSKILNVLFWCGWFLSLVVGLLILAGLA